MERIVIKAEGALFLCRDALADELKLNAPCRRISHLHHFLFGLVIGVRRRFLLTTIGGWDDIGQPKDAVALILKSNLISQLFERAADATSACSRNSFSFTQ
jgi:hypothetical protein